ncbi:uncharacterized protein EI97DRAFT_152349 [Westerdykella ornata]|uniref:Uncharacterized protein n=1 Tax=Westerdykella ornata TaxID=318751 RepID=A0A6A6JBZ3_WESOR|nr:uncharacterized protein EI97DRAFT_152349 [Westerdykella ornata]KAF2273518.1 hypothetical protein EI97DRAFT_152349 [Westerdykella ornata]
MLRRNKKIIVPFKHLAGTVHISGASAHHTILDSPAAVSWLLTFLDRSTSRDPGRRYHLRTTAPSHKIVTTIDKLIPVPGMRWHHAVIHAGEAPNPLDASHSQKPLLELHSGVVLRHQKPGLKVPDPFLWIETPVSRPSWRWRSSPPVSRWTFVFSSLVYESLISKIVPQFLQQDTAEDGNRRADCDFGANYPFPAQGGAPEAPECRYHSRELKKLISGESIPR